MYKILAFEQLIKYINTKIGQTRHDEKPGLSHAAHMGCIMHLGNLV